MISQADSYLMVHDSDQVESSIGISASLANSVNFASWQNSVPLIQTLIVHGMATETLDHVELRMATTPPFTRPKLWKIDRLVNGSQVTIRDRDLEFDADYLSGLNEAERCQVHLSLHHRDDVLHSEIHEVRALARDEWGGMSDMGELLGAFVMPNDPAIAKILKTAGEVLECHGHSPALDGYQSGDPRRAYLLAAAIWSAIGGDSLTYAVPPTSFEKLGQKVRRPAAVLERGLGTCLDLTLLFAAALEAAGLHPVIVMQRGHCFAGVWLVEKTFGRLIESDCTEVRKAIASHELVTFESTLITHRPAAGFEAAVQTAHAATLEREEEKFVGAIDIARTRMAQVRPLASHDQGHAVQEPQESDASPLPLPAMPRFDSIAGDTVEQKPTTADGRIDRWQRKLLDLSLRNRLLNFKDSVQTVPFLCPDMPLLEDRLAAGARLRAVSAADECTIKNRDEQLHADRTHQDILTEFGLSALQRNELASPLSGHELTGRLTNLYRRVRNDLAEGGTNTLFLAVGFLRWKRKPEDKTSYRAPLLLIPVSLTRKSAVSPFRIEHHEDDVRFNATLIQLLKRDFGRDLSMFECDLPTDDQGVDVPLLLQRVRHEIRDIPGFEVVDETALSTFSFAKYLMWKDMVDRADQLANSRVVHHLIHEPDKPFASGCSGGLPSGDRIDEQFAPQELVHPLPADSTQLAAIMAAAEGQDFVLVGPPGTGKSQTIANMIAQCLARKKTVLFVAEKTAALDVVHRRLCDNGLGDFCLELHSNKAERRRFLAQLGNSWENNLRTEESEWLTINERLKVRRDQLNQYVAALHDKHPSGWTVFRAMGLSVREKYTHSPELNWSESRRLDAAAFQTLCQLVDELALTFGAMDVSVDLSAVRSSEWSARWETQLLSATNAVEAAAKNLQTAISEFSETFNLARQDCSWDELQHLTEFCQAVLKNAEENYPIAFHERIGEMLPAASELESVIQRFREAHCATSATFDIGLLEEMPIGDLDRQWREACAGIWPLSWLAKRKVRKLLQTYVLKGHTEPQVDLGRLRTMREQLAAIDANLLSGQSPHWQRENTDTSVLRRHLQQAVAARRAIENVGRIAGCVSGFSESVERVFTQGSDDAVMIARSRSFVDAVSEFRSATDKFKEAAAALPYDQQTVSITAETRETAERIKQHRSELQRWTAWRRVSQRAEGQGLEAFVSALESQEISPPELRMRFELAFVRWWLPQAIDGNDVLRSFQRFQHEDAIEDFRRLDELARTNASSRVRQVSRNGLPAPDSVPRKSQLGLLRHQMQLKRPSKTIREVISGMSDSFSQLAPCVMMSPLSIAQYLPAGHALFDVVIFDEASQISTWDAIGAIARGRQTIIVGDPKQLPPTNFFGRADSEEADELEDYECDLESILDECQASGLPTLQLNWHYRSRHESLITFSNWKYYGNKLVTFPSAVTDDRAVTLRHLPHAVYDRGKSRTNRTEAQAIVDDAVKRMKLALTLPEDRRPTLGVITFNSQQQSLIQDLFDQALRESPELEWYFEDARIEPTVVKNLENVQGDERDIMYFSITFGPDPSGKFSLTFGALNRDGGQRRLNVAVTRSRQELVVYSSFTADQLNAERTKAQGVHDLKTFLDFADRGAVALAAESRGSVGGFDSPFEEAVAAALEQRGWQVTPQVGVSGFRVDLGVVHPDRPGVYLAGVECDGATYHRSTTARDRDKTREHILTNLGWTILRVWSPDWWYDAEYAVQQLDAALRERLDDERSHQPTNTNRDETSGSSLQPTEQPALTL